jgi:hypothetical protein
MFKQFNKSGRTMKFSCFYNIILSSALTLISSCSFSQRTTLENIPSNEQILCGNANNGVRIVPQDEMSSRYEAGERVRAIFWIQVYADNTSNRPIESFLKPGSLMVRIEADERSTGGSAAVTIGEKLKVGNTFKYKRMTWKILNIGNNGIGIKNLEDNLCRYKFMHIQEIQYERDRPSP